MSRNIVVPREMEPANLSLKSRLAISHFRAGLNMPEIETCFRQQPKLIAPHGTDPRRGEKDQAVRVSIHVIGRGLPGAYQFLKTPRIFLASTHSYT